MSSSSAVLSRPGRSPMPVSSAISARAAKEFSVSSLAWGCADYARSASPWGGEADLSARAGLWQAIPVRPLTRPGFCRRLCGVAQAGQEAVDALEQCIGMLAELAGRDHDMVGERARLAGGLACTGDVLGDFAGAGRGLLHAARNLAGRRILLLDRRRDGGGDAADFADGVADAADRDDAVAGGGLDRGDLAGGPLGRLGGRAGA